MLDVLRLLAVATIRILKTSLPKLYFDISSACNRSTTAKQKLIFASFLIMNL